jgi:putative transposase
MKASKFSETQIAFVLKQAEGGSAVAEVCRKALYALLTVG